MTNLISNWRPAAMHRFVVIFGLAAASMAGAFVVPAHADEHRNDSWHAREHARDVQRSREVHRYDGYDRRPDVYYSAPPVVYLPPNYYQQPTASLNFSFPFLYR